jgi:Tol biopolymer transport system component
LQDIAQDGRVLLTSQTLRRGTFVLGKGMQKEANIAVLDWNIARDISADGELVLSTEEGEGGGVNYSIYLRKLDGTPPTRLGEGDGWALSADRKWIVSTDLGEHPQISLLPTGAGEPRQITHDQNEHAEVRFFPDGKHIAFTAVEPHGKPRVYIQDLNSEAARAITPAGLSLAQVSPDGRSVLAADARAQYWIYPVEGGEPRQVPGLNPKDRVAGWSDDGKSLFVWGIQEVPGTIYLVDIASGARKILQRVAPSDTAGVFGIGPVAVTPNGKYYVYSFTRELSDLYLVTGLK